MTTATVRDRPGVVQTIVRWTLQVLLAMAFLAAAGAKLAGVPMMVETFDAIGLGQGFRYLTALVEIVGAIALLIPRSALFGAILLGVTMVFAVLAHLTVLGTSPAPAAVLMVLCASLVWLRRAQLSAAWAKQGPAR